jgi:hypothetical protein
MGHPELGFNDDPNVRRYFLPHEMTALAIIREMSTDARWSYQEWSRAVPVNTVAGLAMARFLRDQGRAGGQELLKQILDGEHESAIQGPKGAVHLAVTAEAYALLSQWEESKRRYRQAIDQIDDVTIKRSWWFNLANVALQLNDSSQSRTALEAAVDVSSSDDISRRALELQRASELPGRLHPGGTRAN